jgi:hypothetical protein
MFSMLRIITMLVPNVIVAMALLPDATAVAADPPPARAVVVTSRGDGPQVYTTTTVPDDGVAQAHTFVISANDDDQNAGPRKIIVKALAGADADLPKVWIGVRVTPVPAPLAAHIGEQGVMIANIVKDSPADQAGLAQYDVVVGLADQDVNNPHDLISAVGAAPAGQAVRLNIIRKGQPQQLTITPVDRPADAAMDMKYDEPDDVLANANVNLRGRALQMGPDGTWTMKDLGDLHGLDVLKDLNLNLDFDKLADPDFFGKNMDIKILRKLDDADDDKAEVRIEVKVKTDDDGSSVTVQRDADGKIHVTRTDPQGQETSATYDDEDALRTGDAAAWELYNEHAAVHGGAHMIHIQPAGPNAARLQQNFQLDIERKMKEAVEATARAREQARAAGEQARAAGEQARERMNKARVEVHRQRDAGGAKVVQEMLMVRVSDNGTISITTEKDGDKLVREFKDIAALKTQAPELYERVKGLLDAAPAGGPS